MDLSVILECNFFLKFKYHLKSTIYVFACMLFVMWFFFNFSYNVLFGYVHRTVLYICMILMFCKGKFSFSFRGTFVCVSLVKWIFVLFWNAILFCSRLRILYILYHLCPCKYVICHAILFCVLMKIGFFSSIKVNIQQALLVTCLEFKDHL